MLLFLAIERLLFGWAHKSIISALTTCLRTTWTSAITSTTATSLMACGSSCMSVTRRLQPLEMLLGSSRCRIQFRQSKRLLHTLFSRTTCTSKWAKINSIPATMVTSLRFSWDWEAAPTSTRPRSSTCSLRTPCLFLKAQSTSLFSRQLSTCSLYRVWTGAVPHAPMVTASKSTATQTEFVCYVQAPASPATTRMPTSALPAMMASSSTQGNVWLLARATCTQTRCSECALKDAMLATSSWRNKTAHDFAWPAMNCALPAKDLLQMTALPAPPELDSAALPASTSAPMVSTLRMESALLANRTANYVPMPPHARVVFRVPSFLEPLAMQNAQMEHSAMHRLWIAINATRNAVLAMVQLQDNAYPALKGSCFQERCAWQPAQKRLTRAIMFANNAVCMWLLAIPRSKRPHAPRKHSC